MREAIQKPEASYHKLTNKELFTEEVNKHWVDLKNNPDTIFENIEIQLDSDNKFNEFKENDTIFNEFLYENSTYEKKKMIKEYFWDKIVGDLYENTVEIMRQADLLDEASNSFEHSYKIETTARLVLENGIFAKYSQQKKKEVVDLLIEASFYPNTFNEKNNNFAFLEENTGASIVDWLSNVGSAFGVGITNAARSIRSLQILLTMFLVSPASLLLGNTVDQAIDATKKGITGREPQRRGSNPSTRRFYEFLEQFWPVKMVYSFLNKDQEDLYKFINKTTNLDDPYVQDILKTAGGNSSKIVRKCWEQHKIQPSSMQQSDSKVWTTIANIFNGRGLSNFIRNPQYATDTQISMLLKHDASDPLYQKRFYNFRICVYDKLFEIILGYSKAIYSMDDSSYEIIKYANDAHKSKNYKAFFDLKPTQDNEKAMFSVMRALVSIDSISKTLKDRKGDLVADPYVDTFSRMLDENVKSTYKALDEMASQKKYNEDRYEEEDPDDETKAEKMQAERFNQKRSIFS